MAAQYDALGNYLGDWETEEERRKREEEEANRTVHTQETKTYGDGTVERTTTEELRPAVQPVAVKPVQQMPVAQPVTQPVSPDTFARMIQAESRGQNFNAQGQPLTSPKGALFAAQVMPATAAQPGFGVRPAQAQTPAKPAEPTKAEAPKELVLAKKKDHSKDKKVDATKSPKKAETTKK